MANSDKAKKNFEDIKESVKETQDFIKEMSKEFPDVINYAKRLAATFSDAKKMSGEQLDTLKKTNDITRDILGNRKNIHKESFETKDLDELSAQYAKEGLGNRKKILQVLKHEQRIQKSINNQINASANAAKKFGDSITSGVQSIPFFGNFLSTALGLDNLGQDISNSLRSGFAKSESGLISFSNQFGGTAAEALGGGFADSFRGKELRPSDFLNLSQFQAELKSGKVVPKMGQTIQEAWGDWKQANLGAEKMKWSPLEMYQKAEGTRDIRRSLQAIGKAIFVNAPLETFFGARMAGSLIGKVLGGAIVAGVGAITMKKFSQGFDALTGPNFLKSFLPGFNTFKNEFGDVSKFSLETAINTLRMRLQFGVSADDSLKLARQMSIISGLSVEGALAQQRSIATQARMANVLPADVIKDMTDNHELIAKFSQDGGMNMARAAIEARKLGLSLSTTSKIADSLLSFESSIESELEASLLIGRQLNLNRARELALMGDMENLQKEIVRQVGSEQQLQQMNVIQRQKLASAIGVEVSELQKLTQGGNISFKNEMMEKFASAMNSTLGRIALLGTSLFFLVRYLRIAGRLLTSSVTAQHQNTGATMMNTRALMGGNVSGLASGGSGGTMLPMGGGGTMGGAALPGGVGRLTKGGLPDMRDPVNKKMFGSVAQRNKMYGISNSSKMGGLLKGGMKTGMMRGFAPLGIGLGMMEFANAQSKGEKASAVGSTSGALAGAAIGTAIAPGIGTIIGGVLGEMAGRKVAESVTSDSTETQKGMLGVLEQIDRKLEKQTMAINDLGGNI
tara:strand:- start:7319 stop:9706 length:2388 start_codon:yes stop_codon:yes gene_type:complete